MQGGNLVVKILALLVEATPATRHDVFHCFHGNQLTVGEVSCELQEIQCTPRVAISGVTKQIERRVVDRIAPAKASLFIGERAHQYPV